MLWFQTPNTKKHHQHPRCPRCMIPCFLGIQRFVAPPQSCASKVIVKPILVLLKSQTLARNFFRFHQLTSLSWNIYFSHGKYCFFYQPNTVFFHGTSIFLGLFPWFSRGFPQQWNIASASSRRTNPSPSPGRPQRSSRSLRFPLQQYLESNGIYTRWCPTTYKLGWWSNNPNNGNIFQWTITITLW